MCRAHDCGRRAVACAVPPVPLLTRRWGRPSRLLCDISCLFFLVPESFIAEHIWETRPAVFEARRHWILRAVTSRRLKNINMHLASRRMRGVAAGSQTAKLAIPAVSARRCDLGVGAPPPPPHTAPDAPILSRSSYIMPAPQAQRLPCVANRGPADWRCVSAILGGETSLGYCV